ncbi:MAG TPA: hypothetical protein PKV72_02840 [Candidatus Peribacteria bacterium]|nr:hypothetical protein [Candidatus Peribacteria bacterium]
MRTLNLSILTGALTTLLLLSACGGGGGDTAQYTYGPLSETGTLVATGVSLVRRGTHVLYAGGKAAYYLESKTVNLQEFAGKRVNVTGDLQPNVSAKYLPVLSVKSVSASDVEEPLHEWKLPGLSLSLQAPESWTATSAEKSISFIASDAGSGTVLTLDAIDAAGLPDGIPTVVAGNVAVKLRNVPLGGEEVHILRSGQVIRVKYTPTGEEPVLQHEQYAALLASLSFTSSSSSSTASSGSGSAAHMQPCGGEAGILCPQGYYCDVFDPKANIGKCRQH